MPKYTYDQFRQNAQNSGLLGEFSHADLQMAEKNPDFGMSILKYKQDYHNATTDEARALANQNAENLRSSWGSYTGGADGGSFAMDVMSPGHFQFSDAPTYSGGDYGDDIAKLWSQQQNFGDFEYGPAPTYNNRYDATIQDLISGILSRPDFSYDPETDPLYSQYKKQYSREGDRAVEDALGAAAAASGGIPSSYASTAAGQAGNYYAAQLTDKIPDLYQLAYQKYLNDYEMKRSDLSMVQGAEQIDYSKYLNDLAQYNTDRAFDYGAWQDRYNQVSNNLSTALSLEDMAYNQYLNKLNQYNTDRSFAYGQFLDELSDQANERNQQIQNAVLAGEYGDFSQLNNLGINTDRNPMDWERQQLLAGQEAERTQQVQALAQAQVDAILSAGGTPSAELLADSGYSQEYADALRNYYLQNPSSKSSRSSSGGGGSSGGGSGGSGSSQNYDALFKAAMDSGHPKSYLANNYKSFGFTSSSGLYDDYESWYDEIQDQQEQEKLSQQANTVLNKIPGANLLTAGNRTITDISQLGNRAMGIANSISRSNSTPAYAADMIQKALDNKEISEYEADFLLRSIGF